jgi:lipopolysaccharide/colanic/teichoic acid biosynthesis glycosyltransferase
MNEVLADESINLEFSPQLFLVPTDLQMKSWRYRGAKRAIDLCCSTLLMLLCLVPGLLIAAAIALTSKGPIFYSEIRVGRGKRPFRIWKFRSMRAPRISHNRAETTAHLKVLTRWRTEKDLPDPRITPVGRFLRSWSLDELPQLINVFRGDMSLVGPRPVVRAELSLYRHLLDFYLATTPGLSGLWQVSGRSNLSFSARARLDASYVQSWSLRQDFVILVRTIPAVVRRVGAR